MPAPGLQINPNRLREIREARGMRRETLAFMISRSFEAVRIMERGDMRHSPETLRRLCEALACAPEDLLDADDDARDGARHRRGGGAK